jgi:fluoride exporter
VIILGLMVAGALGAVLRYQVDRSVQHRLGSDMPLGIMVVNVSGSLALGVLTGAALHHALSSPWLVVAGTGFVGSYTTFSTLTLDTVRLADNHQWGTSVLNLVASLILGVGAAAAGLALGALT